MPGKPLNPPAVVGGLISYRIRLVQIAAYKRFESALRHMGPAPRYLGLLGLIAANPGAAQSRLAEEVHLDRSSLVAILNILERGDLIERRQASADKRVRRVYLTRSGQAVLDVVAPLVASHEASLLEGLSPADRAQLTALLDQLGENLRQLPPDVPFNQKRVAK
ncbi:MAG: MarR family winged helix-turn-helix transcriptional regulator [Pararhodobacter sp.]